MSAAISAYTTTDALRGAIGVTDNEITDEMLTSQRLDLELEADLLAWLSDHATLYADGIAAGATTTEKQIAAHIVLYSQWFVASLAVDSMRLGLPQMLSDGKSEIRRFSELDLDELSAKVAGRREYHRAKLYELVYDEPAVETVSIMALSTPDYDPVAGE